MKTTKFKVYDKTEFDISVMYYPDPDSKIAEALTVGKNKVKDFDDINIGDYVEGVLVLLPNKIMSVQFVGKV